MTHPRTEGFEAVKPLLPAIGQGSTCLGCNFKSAEVLR